MLYLGTVPVDTEQTLTHALGPRDRKFDFQSHIQFTSHEKQHKLLCLVRLTIVNTLKYEYSYDTRTPIGDTYCFAHA